MADNLSASFSIDTSKARVDLKLLNKDLKDLNKEIDNAIKAGDITQAHQLSVEYSNIDKQAAQLTRTIKVQRTETVHADNALKELIHSGRGLGRVAAEFGNLTRGAESVAGILGNLAGGFSGGLFGVAVARGFDKLIASIDALSERLTKIRDFSRETSAKPLIVQGMQELADQTGESAETANKFLTGLSTTLTKVATQTRDVQTGLLAGGKAAADANRNFGQFGDKVVEVNRGGVAVTRDFSDALKILQVNEDRLVKLPIEQQMKTVTEAFLRAEQNAKRLGLTQLQLNAISKDIFGVPQESADVLAKAYLGITAKTAELAKTHRGATDAALKDNKELIQSQKEVDTAATEAGSEIANSIRETRIEFNKFEVEVIKGLPKALSEMFDFRVLKQIFGPSPAASARIPPPLLSGVPDPTASDKIKTDGITKKISDFFKGVEYVDPNASDQIQTEFADLPSFFTKLTDNLSKIWDGFWKHLSISAQAAELNVKTGAQAAGSEVQPTAQAAQNALPYVGRGPGTGDTGGYGPASLGGAGYGPGSRATQSILPGVSDYQAPPPHIVYPAAESAARGWDAVSKSAADFAAATQSAADATAKAADAWVDPSVQAHAAGGMIRGPGTGTSDSILARLSNGEFVMRASAVRAWGADFLQGLNSFADGGLVRPIPRFADGGLVTAGAGTPVHLHLGGHSFALSGNEGVVSALVSEAHHQQMRSAGVKPSWFAGRPSGH